ncbi:MAG TPA: DUF3298 and DUF4163 domain-containing protein [Candidatus Acidoferrum sp.]|nr:DUF3298 and DUF4163 domain-containing protein [Candidatus Acidoferrum sp.]
MKSRNTSAKIRMSTDKRTYTYESVPVLTLSTTYPNVRLRGAPEVESRINCRIQTEVADFLCNASNVLYRQAVQGYQYARKNGFPFNPYDAVMQYEVTYNQNCHLSVYVDEYLYTGGAHGNTLRSSDTWDLYDGCAMTLSALFEPDFDYRGMLTAQLIRQADRNMQENPGIYFEEYRDLILMNFNEESFYLTPEGLAIYFQQYEIAPYASGIIVFTIPYETLGWRPSCK